MSDSEIETLCDRFDSAWSSEEPLEIESLLRQVAKQNRVRLLKALLEIEFEYRLTAGESPDVDAYADRFKGRRNWITDPLRAAQDRLNKDQSTKLAPADHSSLGARSPRVSGSGRQIGPYKLLQQIGEGGMGTVFMAEQTEPVRRRVALKLIRSGFDRKEVIGRFEAERQALAMMDHPNIAKVLDAGATNQGSPYFVMELVNGIRITDYCDKYKLSVEDRLKLLVQACKAIQHAHQKGIIHRDIKPSNVLVTQHDGVPVVKVIDFGLAKALQNSQRLTDKTMFTEFGQVVGTLQYMSPEQAEMNALDVDTRSDVYSLGVLLYELLTGSTPIDRQMLQQLALDRVLAAIREIEPPRPSLRLSSLGESATGISEQRKTDPKKLGILLRGDLDWIAVKALEKDRHRRYETANELSDDVCRYLNDEAIVARPPSFAYRLSKSYRKHRGAMIAGATVVGLLIAGLAGTSTMWWRAVESESLAELSESRAIEASELAKASEADAIAAREEALTEAENARQAELEASEAASEASRQKIIAESAAAAAEKAKADAIAEAALARQAESEAIAAKEEAARKAAEAQKAQAQVETTLARSNFFLALARWDSGRVSEAREFLDRVMPLYRNVEWHFANRKLYGSTITCYGHESWVEAVDFSDDGDLIASGGGDETIKIWNSATGHEVATLLGHTAPVEVVSFDRSGRRIVSGSRNGTVLIWDLHSGEPILTCAMQRQVGRVSFSPDGTRVIASERNIGSNPKGIIKMWDAATGNELFEVKGVSPCFTPDGRHFASIQPDNTVATWNSETGEQIRVMRIHAERELSYSPDGKKLAALVPGNLIRVWDAEKGIHILDLSGNAISVTNFCFSPDGRRIASGGTDSTFRLWDAESGSELRTFKGHTGRTVSDPSFSSDGRRIATAGGWDGTVKVWDSLSTEEAYTLGGNQSGFQSICHSPDGKLIVSGSEDGGVKIWDATTGTEVRTLRQFGKTISQVSFSPSGRVIASSSLDKSGHSVQLWDTATGKELTSIDEGNAIAFNPGESLVATGSLSGFVKLLDAASLETVEQFDGANRPVVSLVFSPGGQQIATANYDHTVSIWDVGSRQQLAVLSGHTDVVWCVAYSRDGSLLASGSWDGSVKIWSTAGGQLLRTLDGHPGEVRGLSFSPDGKRLVSGCRNQFVDGMNVLTLWDTTNGDELLTLTGHSADVTCVQFSPSGNRIISGSADGTIKVWSLESGKEVKHLRGHKKLVSCVSLSRDGNQLASGSRDGSVKIWDTSDGSELWALSAHTKRVDSLSFSPDSSRIFSADEDQRLTWDLRTGALMADHDAEAIQNAPQSTTPRRQASISKATRHGHLLAVPSNNEVLLVDLAFKRTPSQQAYRTFKAKPKPWWHEEQAKRAIDAGDWFAAIFHSAWLLKVRPDSLFAYEQLHASHAKLPPSTAKLVPTVVTRALAMPKPDIELEP